MFLQGEKALKHACQLVLFHQNIGLIKNNRKNVQSWNFCEGKMSMPNEIKAIKTVELILWLLEMENFMSYNTPFISFE